jgi:hypothetical protein
MLFEERKLICTRHGAPLKDPDSANTPEGTYTWLRTLIKRQMQVFGSVRDYKVNGNRISSIISDAKKLSGLRQKLDLNEDYLLRVKVELPKGDMFICMVNDQFHKTGFSPMKEPSKWNAFTQPIRHHRWPAYSSVAAFISSLSDERVDEETRKNVEMLFKLNSASLDPPTP